MSGYSAVSAKADRWLKTRAQRAVDELIGDPDEGADAEYALLLLTYLSGEVSRRRRALRRLAGR